MKQMPTREQVQEAYASVQKYLRENTTGLTQEQLAEETYTSKDYQCRLECAARCPNLLYFIRNALAMDVDPVLVLSMVLRYLGL
jgi:predicted transcriptional regulator